jgi:hypothetical protein
MTITQTTQAGRDFQALITGPDEYSVLQAVSLLQSRYRDMMLEPMDAASQGIDQRWSVILRPTVELF